MGINRCFNGNTTKGAQFLAGQMDAQDGVASNEPWIYGLQWHGKDGFQVSAKRLQCCLPEFSAVT